jgi:hypothetical protein
LLHIPDGDLVDAADKLTKSLIDNPEWTGLNINVEAAIDTNFIKLLTQGLISSILTPKILLPIFTMLQSLGQSYNINSYMDFVKAFKSYVINLTSRIGSLFVFELFQLIKKDIKNLIKPVIVDINLEKKHKQIVMIMKLVSLLLIVGKLIMDWKKCKSIVDELLALLKIATTKPSVGGIPLPLLLAAELLDGYSESRAFLGTIEEMQKLGIPTGAMPDGSPNLDLLSKFAQMRSMANEDAENGKLTVGIPQLAMLPSGFTMPRKAGGKKL